MITPLPAGSTFAGYQVDAVLARGGMGVVYLATELRPRRRIALKLIAPALAADPAYRERFLREVDALAALEHPERRPDPRGGRMGRSALPGDALPRRSRSRRGGPDAGAAPAGRGPGPAGADRGRPRRRARTRHRPPRRDAVEHPARRPGDPVPHRLRAHEAGGDRRPDRPHAGAHGDAGVHGARAVLDRGCRPGTRPGAGPARRRLRPRLRAGHPAHRLAALSPRLVRGGAMGARARGAAERRRAAAGPPAGNRRRRCPRPGEGPRGPFPVARRALSPRHAWRWRRC